MKRKFWTQSEDDFLRVNYSHMTAEEMADKLDRTIKAVRNRITSIGLRLDSEARKRRGTFSKGTRNSPATEFPKGNIPWNKGKKGTHFSPGTEFKKGNLPHNTRHDGCIVIRHRKDRNEKPYKYIRISLGKWEPYHKWLWEQEYGPVPDGKIIVFRKGCDTLDVKLENLEMVTRREHLQRNRNREKFAISMKRVWASGKIFQKDSYIAGLLAHGDKVLKDLLLSDGEQIIKAKRMQLKLRRAIRDVVTGE